MLWSTQETQLPSKHLPLAQSFGTRHALSLPQLSQNVPPQSTSVSPPSWAPDWQEKQAPSKHCPLAQSLPATHAEPSPQSLETLRQTLPPQSTSVSPLPSSRAVAAGDGRRWDRADHRVRARVAVAGDAVAVAAAHRPRQALARAVLADAGAAAVDVRLVAVLDAV